tara:strand:+ start:2069 stop:2491 length:423 start_codon:yes stop_codon:yes gene_type:complete
MIKTQLTTDKFAMTVSFACVLHCFFVPSFIILSSGLIPFALDNEVVHKLIVLIAVPVSVFSLYLGWKNHKTFSFIPAGIIGLMLLITAVIMGESTLGEFGEKGLTLLGSIFVAFAHFRNHQICKQLDCDCHEDDGVISGS